MAKRWKKEDLTYLKRYAGTKRLEELAKRFKTDTETVSVQLEGLGVAAKDSVTRIRLEHDPSVKTYARAIKALGQKKWQQAHDLFREILEETDRPELADRSRRYLAVAEQKLGGGQTAKSVDPFLEAVYERNRGNLEEALSLCSRGGRQGKDERFSYLAASIHAVRGEADEAAKLLAAAIDLNPKNRIHAYHDADFDELRSHEEHSSLFD